MERVYGFNISQGLIDFNSGFSKFNTSLLIVDYSELKNSSSEVPSYICIQKLSETNWNGTECVTNN